MCGGGWQPLLGVMDADIHPTMIENPALQTLGLSRSFGEFQAVYPLDIKIYPGEVISLTGPNGAGKTTLLCCLSGLLRPTKGNILVEGYDLYEDEVAAKQRLAFVPDVPRFYPELTSWEHLRFISLAFGVEQDWETRAQRLLREFGLWESRDLYPHNLSRGMRLKLGVAMALIRPFIVLIMDEPTSALDSESVAVLLEKLKALRENGCAILLTSHDISVVQALGGISWRMEHGEVLVS
jgi:ABC-2 type transport system ATP-binding protein